MKKKRIILIFLIIAAVIFIFAVRSYCGRKPFKNLSASEIKSVSVWLSPPDVTLELNQEEIEVLVNLLHHTVIYSEDNSYTEYDGQGVIFTIEKTDGSQISVMAYNPFLVIDGTGYKTKYEPCEELNALGNQIERSRK